MHADITDKILKSFFEVHTALDYGCLESVYSRAMAVALSRNGLQWRREVPYNVYFHGECVGEYRADLVVENKVIVEIKSVSGIGPVHDRQIYNYLRLSNLQVGLILNFGPTANFHRYVNTHRRL
ncbi:MAG: GxxExxY protein [Gemmatimonas sp.]